MDTGSSADPVEELYDARIRGAAVIGTADGQRVHLHGGCWLAPVGDDPPRLMVAFPKEFEGADIVTSSGIFAVGITAAERPAVLGALFEGRPPVTDASRHLFLRTPNGAVVPASSVAYFDLRLTRSVDMGDFLLAIGDVTGAAVLNPSYRNLTVNEIIADADPRGEKEALLPFQGFDYDLSRLALAPSEAVGPVRFEDIYARRAWGMFFVSVAHQGRAHHHLGSWMVQVSHAPARMAVAFRKSWEAAAWVEAGAPLAMTLVARDQEDVVRALADAPEDPSRLRGDLMLLGDGLSVLESGVAYFVCRPESTLDLGEVVLAIATVEEYSWLRREAANLTDADAAAIAAAWTEPERGFPLSELTLAI